MGTAALKGLPFNRILSFVGFLHGLRVQEGVSEAP